MASLRLIPNFLIFLLFSSIFLSLAVYSQTSYQLRLFDFADYSPSCPEDSCYTVDDLVKQALEFGLDSREKIQMLFQARAQVKVKIGGLLPQLNIMAVASSAMSGSVSLDAVIPFVGFLFPSHWLGWLSARSLKKAEAYSLNTLFADRAQAIQHLYFDIQRQIWSIRILKFYLDEVETLTEFLNTQRIYGLRQITMEDIAILENIKGAMAYDLAFIDNLSAVLPQLATAIGLEPNFDWSTLQVESHNLVSLNNLRQREYKEYYPRAIALSTEIKNVASLVKAAKNDKNAAYFDFFDPASGNNLGFDFGYRIRIARSNVDVLKILMQRTRMQISNQIHNALNNYNDSISAFPGIIEGLFYLEYLRESTEKNLNDTSQPFDIMKIIRYFDYAKSQVLRYIQSYFIFKQAKADLDRYTWNGRIYDIVRDYHAIKLPQILHKVKKKYSCQQIVKKRKNKIKNFRQRCCSYKENK